MRQHNLEKKELEIKDIQEFIVLIVFIDRFDKWGLLYIRLYFESFNYRPFQRRRTYRVETRGQDAIFSY